jgi:hypothetical protein
MRKPTTLGTTTRAAWPAGFELPLIGPAAAAIEAKSSAAVTTTISLFKEFSPSTLGREGRLPLYTRTRAEPEKSLPPPQEV